MSGADARENAAPELGSSQPHNTDPFRVTTSRRTLAAGAAWAVPAVAGVAPLKAFAASPLGCTNYTYSQHRAASQFLSGTLLGTRLSQVFQDESWTDFSLADLRGLSVSYLFPSLTVDPTNAEAVTGVYGAYRKQLDLAALQALEVIASVQLGSLIKAPVGVLNQWAQVVYSNGYSNGSTGAIDNSSGGIDFSQEASSTTYASINLKNLLNNALDGGLAGLGTFTSNITDLSLDIGAIAGRAWQDQCTNCVKRDYLLAWAKLVVASPLLSALYSAIQTSVNNVATTLNGLIGSDSAVIAALKAITDSVKNVTLGLVTVDTSLSVSMATAPTLDVLASDLFPASTLLDATLGDTASENALTIDLGSLLGGAYVADSWVDGTSGFLNGLPPNTNLLSNLLATPPDGQPTTVARLIEELGLIASNAATRLKPALESAITVSLTISTLLLGTVATISLYQGEGGTTAASIQDVLDGDFYLKVSVLNDISIGSLKLSDVLATLVGDLVFKGLVKALVQTIDDLIVDAVLTSAVNTAVTNLTGFVDTLLTQLFINPGVISLTANAQNDPNIACTPPTTYGPEPSDWATGAPEAPPTAHLVQGEYDVAALRIGVLNALSDKVVTLYLARAAVGPTVATAI